MAYSNQLMEHLHPDDAVEQLRNIHHVLRPGGVYICITPNKLCGPHDVSRGFDEKPTGFHLKEYDNRDLTRLFRQAGFRRVSGWFSYQHFVLAWTLPMAPFRAAERLLSLAPLRLRQRLGMPLIGLKFIGYKRRDEPIAWHPQDNLIWWSSSRSARLAAGSLRPSRSAVIGFLSRRSGPPKGWRCIVTVTGCGMRPGGHCHIRLAGAASVCAQIFCVDQASMRTHVSWCQTLKAFVRITRYDPAVNKWRRGWKCP